LHGGHVSAHSDGEGRGARFEITLPMTAHPEADDASDDLAGERRRVLVVEDNTDAALMMVTLLELAGHVVQVASDGEAALVLARDLRPEVVLCDIGLPGSLDGYDVARGLRAEHGEDV